MISKQTAMDIALAYREIEAAEKLLEDITEAHKQRKPPDMRDAFGRPVGGLQLGIPSGEGSHKLFYVPWSLAQPILEAHIALQKSKVLALSEKARFELEPVQTP